MIKARQVARLFAFVLVLWTALLGSMARAQEKIDVATALSMAQSGEVLLLDIRTPREWKQTGISPLAVTLNMHSRTFGSDLMSLINSNRDRPIALMCATGYRSGYLSGIMQEAGFSSIYDVTEGMLGSDAGPGWIDAGLPVVPYASQNN